MSDMTPVISGGVRERRKHDSADKQVQGAAPYVDDIAEPHNCLHLALGLSTIAHGTIRNMDLDPVRNAPGVEFVFTSDDVPGVNDASPIAGDDPLFSTGDINWHGQSLFVVAAKTRREALRAARLATIDYDEKTPLLTIQDAMKAKAFLLDDHVMARGNAKAALDTAPNRSKFSLSMGGQEHFYLEGQISMAVPLEGDEMLVHVSSQHPTEVQHNVARVLGVPDACIFTEVRRMGGGFGGKETQPAIYASIAAMVAKLTGRAAKLRLDRDDDMVLTGKRHHADIDVDIGFDDDGKILALDIIQMIGCGCSADVSAAIADRAMFHAENCYWIPDIHILSHRLKTHTVSNTAYRGFGGPQGIVGMERIIHHIARKTGLDPLTVRQRNLYGKTTNNVTPYGQLVEDNIAPEIIADLRDRADYDKRRQDIADFNATNTILKKGLALTPVKFGISFTATHFNQAGALVNVYTDGSVALNHGGTEMGQGLYTKVAQVVANAFMIDGDRIRITATNTGKVPNTSATAASSGSDMNGWAAHNAAITIRQRLTDFIAERHQADAKDVEWLPNRVKVGGDEITWNDLIKQAYLARIQLSATGFYTTPKIKYDPKTMQGRPFYYFAYGAACSEVTIDTLTGENRIDRVDIIHDVGKSLNPALDLGQIEGAFVQGAGWLTCEELVWDGQGRLATHAPSTYKIPACSDRARQMTIDLWDGENVEDSIHKSKAVGEPPFMLGISVYEAIQDAVASLDGYASDPMLDAPATPERIQDAVTRMKAGTT